MPRATRNPGDPIITSPRRLPGRTSSRLARRLDALLIDRLLPGPGPAAQRTVICTDCSLDGGPFDEVEAAYFVRLHEELHHGARRTYRTSQERKAGA